MHRVSSAVICGFALALVGISVVSVQHPGGNAETTKLTGGETFAAIRDAAGPELKMKGDPGRPTDAGMRQIVGGGLSLGPQANK